METNDVTTEAAVGDAVSPAALKKMRAPALRALCRSMGLDHRGTVAELVRRVERDRAEAATWAEELASPPVFPDGYRIVLDGDVVVPLKLAAVPCASGRRRMVVLCSYTLPASVARSGCDEHVESRAFSVADALSVVRRNVGANHHIREFLEPGQAPRAELFAETESGAAQAALAGDFRERARRGWRCYADVWAPAWASAFAHAVGQSRWRYDVAGHFAVVELDPPVQIDLAPLFELMREADEHHATLLLRAHVHAALTAGGYALRSLWVRPPAVRA